MTTPRLKPLSEQAVVIVGGSSGIGRVTARRFAEEGAQVLVAARGEPGLRSVVEEIRAAGGQAEFHLADAADPDAMTALAQRAVELFGRIDTWVHVAAVSIWAEAEETTPEEYRQVIEVNLLGQIHGALAALPYLKENGGALIAISSIESRVGLPFQAAYAASKHGLVGFLDSLRLELKDQGTPVSVTNIMPASIDTPLFEKARTRIGYQPKGVPPLYAPEDVARAILYAAEHPVRDLMVGGVGRLLAGSQSLWPAATDELLLRTAIDGQYSDIRKTDAAPNNLFNSLPGNDRETGTGRHRSFSAYTWLATHPPVLYALAGAMAGMLLLGSRRSAAR